MTEIETKALAILETFNLDVFPIDVKKLAEKLDLTILEEDFEDAIAGLLYYKNGSGYIGVNKSHHDNRQRFTIGHEIGHHALHHDINELHWDKKSFVFYRADNNSPDKKQESEANQFSAALLMPKTMLKRFIDSENIDLNDEIHIQKLSIKLKVSQQALTFRLLNLGMISYN